jgi:cyclophilin family peptidyl-prolyl cis-trans isomerase
VRPLFSILLPAVYLALNLSVACAQDMTPPAVAKAVGHVIVDEGAMPKIINLNQTFKLQGVKTEVVRFATTLGNVDVELYPGACPKTVANFLAYVNAGSGQDGGYNGSIIQRSVPGFVLQGGGYYVSDNGINAITAMGAVASEPGISNTAGTLGVALLDGPTTGTDAWFFNLADNSDLDGTQYGGPFTVFGRVIEDGMDTLQAIAAIPTYDLSSSLGDSFENVPLINYNAAKGAAADNLIYVKTITKIPLTPAVPGGPGLLTLKVFSNSNPEIVRAKIAGRKLTLTFNKTGTAKIVLEATDSANSTVKTSFKVTVQKD